MTDLESLFTLFASHPGAGSVMVSHDSALNHKLEASSAVCAALLSRDARVLPLANRQGQLCASYPPDVLCVLGARAPTSAASAPALKNDDDSADSVLFEEPADDDDDDGQDDVFQLDEESEAAVERDLRLWARSVQAARLARVRTRFPVPVLAYGAHLLCRSSTLAHKLELMLNRSAADSLNDSGGGGGGGEAADGDEADGGDSGVDRARRKDIELLRLARVAFVCDLMVEDRKQVYGVHVCSSEKVDRRDRYASFGLASMPYPGCEFFREVAAANGMPQGLMPAWPDSDPAGCNERFRRLAPCRLLASAEYRALDLVALTQVYLKTLLQLLSVGGVLCHCISGWDRTPLFISLLRISLWADGAAHASLSVDELLYLTVAYDWMLFGHQLRDRATRNEMVFSFCFDFLQFIEDGQFSIAAIEGKQPPPPSPQQPPSSSSPSSPPQPQPQPSLLAAITGSSPVAIARIKSNSSFEGGGGSSQGGASSWHVLDQERALSASSFDDNIGGAAAQQALHAARSTRRAERLSELRLRFRQIFDKSMKPLLAKPNGAHGVGHDFVNYSKQLWRLVAENR